MIRETYNCYVLFNDNTEITYKNIKGVDVHDHWYMIIAPDDTTSLVLINTVKAIGIIPYVKKGVK